jgi:hypothetical protein
MDKTQNDGPGKVSTVSVYFRRVRASLADLRLDAS